MEKEIVFVTTNQGKIASAQKYLKNIKLISYNAELVEPRSDDIKEIARQKVLQAHNIVRKPCIALDAGFFVRAYNGFPRAYVNHMLDTLGIDGLLKLMDGNEDRYCEFRSCLAYYDGNTLEFFENKSPGTLSDKIRGNDNINRWSDLWYIFIPEGFTKTLAEFTEQDFEEYDKVKDVSAIKKFGDWYETIDKSEDSTKMQRITMSI